MTGQYASAAVQIVLKQPFYGGQTHRLEDCERYVDVFAVGWPAIHRQAFACGPSMSYQSRDLWRQILQVSLGTFF